MPLVSGPRVRSEYSFWSAVTACTACAAADGLRPRLRQPKVSDLARCDKLLNGSRHVFYRHVGINAMLICELDGNRLSDGLQIKRTGWSPHQLTAYLFHPEIQNLIGEGRNIPQPCVSRIVSENLFHCPLKNRKRHNAQSIICWFQAALIAALSDAASLPRCFVNNDFSTVTSRLVARPTAFRGQHRSSREVRHPAGRNTKLR